MIDRLDLSPGVVELSLGDPRLRGKGADLALLALTKTPQRACPIAAAVGRDIAPEGARVAAPWAVFAMDMRASRMTEG